jgi:hypothetical protein
MIWLTNTYCYVHTFIHFGTTGSTTQSLFYTLSSSPLHTHQDSQSSLVASWQQIFQSHWHFKSYVKSCCDSLIQFLPLFCACQFRRLDSTRLVYSTTTVLYSTTLCLLFKRPSLSIYNPSVRTPRKTQHVLLRRHVYWSVTLQWMSYCHVRVNCGNVFTEPLPSNWHTHHNILLVYAFNYINSERMNLCLMIVQNKRLWYSSWKSGETFTYFFVRSQAYIWVRIYRIHIRIYIYVTLQKFILSSPARNIPVGFKCSGSYLKVIRNVIIF